MDISLSENVIANYLSKEELPPAGSVFQVIATKKIEVCPNSHLFVIQQLKDDLLF